MKRIKKCLLFLFLIMLMIPFAKVEAKATCSDVKKEMNELKLIDDAMRKLKCDNATTEKVLAQCNDLSVSKSDIVATLFQYYDAKVCPSKELTSIINDYKSDCSNEITSKFKDFVESLLKLFYITAPFIMILFGSLDFFKIMAGASPDQIKKHRSNFIKRVIAFVLLYLTPLFVRTVFSITPYSLDESPYVCAEEITFMPKLSSKEVTGYYNPNAGGDGGAKIAEAAKANADFAKAHNFTYGCTSTVKSAYTTNNSAKEVCCATLVSVSIYKAGIYEASEFNYGIHSAPATTTFLIKKGWTFINSTKEKDLQPGDVLIYECNDKCNTVHTPPVINGKSVHIGHVAIYAGNGKQYDHGTTNSIQKGTIDFWTKGKTKHLYGALRYNGN